MKTSIWTAAAALAVGGFVIGGATILRVDAGPINPPTGPVASTGVTLTQLADLSGGPLFPGRAVFGAHPTLIALSFVGAAGTVPQGDDTVCGLKDVSLCFSSSFQPTRGIGSRQSPTGNVIHGDVDLTKEMDTASADLMSAACASTVIQEATIDFFRTGPTGTCTRYMQWRLENAQVVDWSSGSAISADGDVIAVEHLSLSYSEVTVTTFLPVLSQTTIAREPCAEVPIPPG